MTSVQHYTIQKIRRTFNSSSTSTQSLYSLKTKPTLSTPLKPQALSINPGKKLSYSSKKRERPLSPEKSSKKSKLCEKAEWKLMISLFDEDTHSSVQFRCFYEDLIIPAVLDESKIVSCVNDDDCKTQDSEIELCSEYLAFQLERSIVEAPCNV